MFDFISDLYGPMMRWDISYKYHPDKKQYSFIEGDNDIEYCVDKDVFEFGMKLDGHTGIYDVDRSLSKSQVEDYLLNLCFKSLVCDQVVAEDMFNYYVPLYVPDKKRIYSFSRFYTKYLFMASIPIFLLGFMLFVNMDIYHINGRNIASGIFVGMFIGSIVHEVSHLLVGLYYDPKEHHEIDFSLLFYFIPSLCYVTRDKQRKSELETKMMISGILANALFSGLFMIAGFIFRSNFMLGIGLANNLAIFDNLFPLFFSDGRKIFENLLSNKTDKSFKVLVWLIIIVLLSVCYVTYRIFVHYWTVRRLM